MLSIILLIVGIANLAVSIKVCWALKNIGKELNQIEDWKSVPTKHYF